MCVLHRCNTRHNQRNRGSGSWDWNKSAKKVKPHKPIRQGSCIICSKPHSVNSHRQHEKNAYKKTHKKTKGPFCTSNEQKKKSRIGLRQKVRDVRAYAGRKRKR